MHVRRSIKLLLVIAFLISGCGSQQAEKRFEDGVEVIINPIKPCRSTLQ